jgi:ATP:ADP antiporter, AAA family
MPFSSLKIHFWKLTDVGAGEARRIGFMAALLFFLLAANNVIKIVRDSLFLNRFPITELAYVYLLAGLIAGTTLSLYARYTSRLSLSRVILASHAFIISNLIIFWLLVTFYDFAWVLYVFYMWSAIVGLVVVAQFWTLANDMFNPREGKRLFGMLSAGGTLGGIAGAFGAHWAVHFLFGTKHLLWLIVTFFAGAFGVVWFALREQQKDRAANPSEEMTMTESKEKQTGVLETLRNSRYLQLIAVLIFVSVIVSTLIDYQFKAAAKEAYPSTDALAVFFGHYYVWLSVVTFLAQVGLTGRLLMGLGLTPSLFLLPLTLVAGSVSFLAWPGLYTATGTRLAEASLRTSVNRSGVEILYLPIPDFIKKKVKVFLDVTVERLGDGTAALLILFYTFFLGGVDVRLLSYFCLGLIFVWATVVFIVQGGYVEALRRSLSYREISLDETRIDYADKRTIAAVLKTLEEKEEQSVVFGLELAEKLDPKVFVPRLSRGLLRHSSSAVRSRAIKLFSLLPDPATLKEITQMLEDKNAEVQAEAIRAAGAIFKKAAIPITRPHLASSNPHVKRRVLECLLRYGDPDTRAAALNAFLDMINDRSAEGEKSRIQAANLAGEIYDREFSAHLARLISDDPSYPVVHAAMAAAGKGKYPGVLQDIIPRLGDNATKVEARGALIQYGEIAVEDLRRALFDPGVSRDIRLNIPRTLSKIHSQAAMNALLSGLLEEDRSIRFNVILALEEMARRFVGLTVDREVIEDAIISDVMLYAQRFIIFFTLFDLREKPLPDGSLLRHALTDSMDRVKERALWLLSLVYPSEDIRRARAALSSEDPTERARAIELLDNLLTGDIKRYVFPLFSDDEHDQRFRAFLDFLQIDVMDAESALRTLLEQSDVWLAAATVWEIGLRKLKGFRDKVAELLNSENVVLREAAGIVIQRIQL